MPDDEAREDNHKNADKSGKKERGEEEREHREEEEKKETAPAPDDEVPPAIVDRFPGTVFPRSHGQPVVYVDRSVWADMAGFLRDEQQFTQCMDVPAVDHLVDAPRLDVPG